MAGITPEEQAANWAAVRRYGRAWAFALILVAAALLGVTTYALGRLGGYLEGKGAACPQASPGRPPGPSPA